LHGRRKRQCKDCSTGRCKHDRQKGGRCKDCQPEGQQAAFMVKHAAYMVGYRKRKAGLLKAA
jgi:hypothetical protein